MRQSLPENPGCVHQLSCKIWVTWALQRCFLAPDTEKPPAYRFAAVRRGLTYVMRLHPGQLLARILDSFSVLVIDGFALGQLLIKEGQTGHSGPNNSPQFVGRLFPQYLHMMGYAAPVNIVRPFTQEIEHLRKGLRH